RKRHRTYPVARHVRLCLLGSCTQAASAGWLFSLCRRQKAAPAGTERSSLLHARLGGAASGCIAVQPASDEPVSHAPAVTDFSVKSLPCCAAMP
ncbi:hypothetical protein PVAP13_6NG179803, partial [Panicum virgatum]